jgi:double-stranded uracil-DNA glycosylase
MLLPDVLMPGLKIVFCGTAAGDESARRGAYYAGPGNKFWATVHQVGLTTDRLRPDEFRTLLDFGIGLTDLVKLTSGGDSALAASDFDVAAFSEKIERFSPTIVAFNGKRAAQEFFASKVPYGKQQDSIGTSAVYVLPSTSGAASGAWDVSFWQEAARAVTSPG